MAGCDVRQIDVTQLKDAGEPGCDLAGSTLLFPNGVSFEVPPIGTAAGQEDTQEPETEHMVVNWGVPGVGAARVEGGQLAELWASTPTARDLQLEHLRISGVATS